MLQEKGKTFAAAAGKVDSKASNRYFVLMWCTSIYVDRKLFNKQLKIDINFFFISITWSWFACNRTAT
jgi:hypothetical protein